MHKYDVLPGLGYLALSRHWRFAVMSNDVKPLAYFTKVFYQVLLGIFSACCHQIVQRLLIFLLCWRSSQQSGPLPQSRLMTLSLCQVRTVEHFTMMLPFMHEISFWGSVTCDSVQWITLFGHSLIQVLCFFCLLFIHFSAAVLQFWRMEVWNDWPTSKWTNNLN